MQKYDKRIKKIFEEIVPNNSECDELFKIMGEHFDYDRCENMKKITALFKLSWKYEYPKEKDGKMTFYGKISEVN